MAFTEYELVVLDDGEIALQCGVVGRNRKAMEPQYCAAVTHFKPKSEEFDIAF